MKQLHHSQAQSCSRTVERFLSQAWCWDTAPALPAHGTVCPPVGQVSLAMS